MLIAAHGVPAYSIALAKSGLDSRRAVRRLTCIDDALLRLPRFELASFRAGAPVRCHPRSTEKPRTFSASVATLKRTDAPLELDAVIALTSITDPPLTESDRDLLWRKYQVPIFEHLVGFDGTVLARECEIHEGLHVVPRNAILEQVDGELIVTSLTGLEYPALRVRTGLTAEWEPAHCECGQTDPRLLNLRPLN